MLCPSLPLVNSSFILFFSNPFQFFAFLCTLCYAGSSYLSYRAWKSTEEGQ